MYIYMEVDSLDVLKNYARTVEIPYFYLWYVSSAKANLNISSL